VAPTFGETGKKDKNDDLPAFLEYRHHRQRRAMEAGHLHLLGGKKIKSNAGLASAVAWIDFNG